jgi:hypothetical protein
MPIDKIMELRFIRAVSRRTTYRLDFLPNLAKYAFQKSGDSLFIVLTSLIIKKIELVEIYFINSSSSEQGIL